MTLGEGLCRGSVASGWNTDVSSGFLSAKWLDVKSELRKVGLGGDFEALDGNLGAC